MQHLNYEKRIEIHIEIQSLLYDRKHKYRQYEIAEIIKVSPWTISNELAWFKRNKELYDAKKAHEMTKEKRSLANKKIHWRVVVWTELESYIHDRISIFRSPEQIARTWNIEQNDTVSWSTIYTYIYTYHPERKKKYLRRKGKKYKYWKWDNIKILNRVSIDERPKEVDNNTHLWHFEWDTIVWNNKSDCIITVIDRKTNYLFARCVKLNPWEKLAVSVSTLMWEMLWWIRKELRKTLTLDNWTEFADHEYVSEICWLSIYFAHPYHSWERGANEHVNGLLRQYLPKWMSFENVTQEELDKYVNLINMRPRKKLNRLTPADVFLPHTII